MVLFILIGTLLLSAYITIRYIIIFKQKSSLAERQEQKPLPRLKTRELFYLCTQASATVSAISLHAFSLQWYTKSFPLGNQTTHPLTGPATVKMRQSIRTLLPE